MARGQDPVRAIHEREFRGGAVEFPTIPNRYGIARWANNTASGNILVKPKQTNIVLPENAFVDITIYGIEEKL